MCIRDSFKLSRQNEHWDSYIFYRGITPDYRADVGFTPKNNRKWLTLSQGYESFFENSLVSKLETSIKGDITYNYENQLKSNNLDLNLSIVTIGKTELQYNYDINFLRNYQNIDSKNVGKSLMETPRLSRREKSNVVASTGLSVSSFGRFIKGIIFSHSA